MTLGRAHRWSLMATIALATLGVVSGSPVLLGGGVALLMALAYGAKDLRATRRSRRRSWIVNGITILVLLTAILLFRRVTIDSVVLVVMVGIANRFLLRAGHRDDLILCAAATVVLTLATTVTPGLAFLFIFACYVPAVHVALLCAQLLAAAEPLAPAERAALTEALAARAAPRRFAYLTSLSLGLSVVGYGVLALFPRYHLLNWLGAGVFLNLAGAANSMELGAGGVRGADTGQVVLWVEPGAAADRTSIEGLYARIYALDVFDGRTFRSTPKEGVAGCLNCQRDKYVRRNERSAVVAVTLDRLVPAGAPQPVALLGRDRPAGPHEPRLNEYESGTVYATMAPGLQAIRYEVELLDRSLVLRPPEESLLLLPPDLDPRLGRLAAGLVAGRTTTEEKIAAILGHFDRGYVYSLEPLPGEAKDPLVRFIFEAKQGHCELYAGAVAVLLRLAGVKARVVTGYYGGHWNTAGGFLELTSGDAHAWVEAYDEAQGWRWVDATPEDRRSRPTDRFAWVNDWIELLEATWYERVVDFDEGRRRQLLRGLTEKIDRLGPDWGEIDGMAATFATGGATRGMGPLLLGGISAVVLGAGLAVWRRRRQLATDRLGQSLRRALGEGPEDNATLGQLLSRISSERRPRAARAVELYQALRFGPAAEAPSPVEVRRAVRAFKAQPR